MTPAHLTRRILIAALLSNTSAVVLAQELVVDTDASSVNQSIVVSIPFDGELIGDYDAKTNPDGTQTRPGLFGGSGNIPVDYSAVFEVDSPTAQSQPSGMITVDAADVGGGFLGIDGFEFDVLSGETVSVDVELAIILQTFRTFSPFSIYPGGFEIPIPLQSGTISSMVIRSESAVDVPVSPVGDGYGFDALLPAVISLEIDFGTGAQPFDLPFVVPFTGGIEIGTTETVLTLSSDLEIEGDQPVDFPPFEQIPLELPTFPPSSQTAGVLLGGTILNLATDIDLSVQVVASGETGNPADFNRDGIVNGADLGILISSWGVCNEECVADLNLDGIVNGSDLGLFIAAWTA